MSPAKRRALVRWTALAVSLLGTLVIMALPAHCLAWIRRTFRPLGGALNWIENSLPYLDMDHVIFFTGLALLWYVVVPISRRRLALLCLLVLAVASELIQFIEPSRTSKLSDVRDDLIGVAIGWLMGWLLMRGVSLFVGARGEGNSLHGVQPVPSARSFDVATPSQESSATASIESQQTNSFREICSRLLCGDSVDMTGFGTSDVDDLINCARREGVRALLCQHLPRMLNAPPELIDRLTADARALAGLEMFRVAECRRVLVALSNADIPVLVLKGLALGAWLYPNNYLRETTDIDLLFSSRADAQRAAGVLKEQGYIQCYKPGEFAHEFVCRNTSAPLTMDLDMHWHLSGMPLFADLFGFDELKNRPVPLQSLGPSARGLGPVNAFVHACIHRASNLDAGLGDRLKWLYDLHLLGVLFQPKDWDELLDVCREHSLHGLVAEGGAAAAMAFGSVIPEAVLASLAAGRRNESFDSTRLHDWRYVQWQNLRALPTWTLRGQWVWQRIFVDLSYLRELYGAERGFMGLWLERMRRGMARLCRRA